MSPAPMPGLPPMGVMQPPPPMPQGMPPGLMPTAPQMGGAPMGDAPTPQGMPPQAQSGRMYNEPDPRQQADHA